MNLETINPATEEVVEQFQQYKDEKINEILEKCHHAHLEWRLLFLYTRAKSVKKLASALRNNKKSLAATITEEMGKPLAQSIAEVDKCAAMIDFYAHNSPVWLEDQAIATEAQKSFVTFQPLGVILAIMPWNFPLWQVLRFAIPAILAGNTVILKHAPNVCRTALALEKLFTECELPDGLFKTVFLGINRIPALIEHPYIQGVSLTGSEKAGRSVAALAGKNLKRAVLELGGSDPYVIFHDADLELAVDTCVDSRLINCGQSCISAKRFIVAEEIADMFEEMFVEKMKSKTMGDPLGKFDIGPMARNDLRRQLHKQATQSVEKGAKLRTGGFIPDETGFYYPPTVLTGVLPGMSVWDEETFGPVAAVTRFNTELEAVRLAQDTPYGLGAALFSKDIDRMEKLAKHKIMAGSVFINDFVRSDARLPFGGIKASGLGRELSHFGLMEFVNIKTVSIK
jgi:succinate-semialdehyde dehydrogenase/glutarate-semialdehyde dehydrogenase